jgi:MraZ protein
MFLGRYSHNLDDKGRLTIPARFRELLEPDGAFIMQGFDHNLMILPSATFHNLSDKVHRMSMTNPDARQLRRLLYSSAERVEVDRAGRILIPQYLRQSAGLETGVTVVGNGDYFELWSPETWQVQDSELQDPLSTATRFADLLLPSE